tara:strand:+ start:404 stop:796 length:393 start_codon:yes stop_codon:yes gene_type:complete
MSNYTKSTNFAVKDGLPVGTAAKRVRGTEIDDEFNSLAIAVASKANGNNAALTGSPTAVTAPAGTNTTQLSTTAFVGTAVSTAIAAIPDSGIADVIIDGAAGAIGKTIYINNAAPADDTIGNAGDIWFEY